MDHPYWISGEFLPPLTLSNANAHCSNNSQIPQAASLDVQKDKVMNIYSLMENNTCSSRVQKFPDITASQKTPGESNVSASYSFLHVSCCGRSSRDVDPGNAVCMDNGETVAHWWKAFSSKTGVRVVEGVRRLGLA